MSHTILLHVPLLLEDEAQPVKRECIAEGMEVPPSPSHSSLQPPLLFLSLSSAFPPLLHLADPCRSPTPPTPKCVRATFAEESKGLVSNEARGTAFMHSGHEYIVR